MICEAGALDPKKVKGKIVVCLRGENARTAKSLNAHHAGAVGMILCNNKDTANDTTADSHIIAASHLTYEDGQVLYAYLNSTRYDILSQITSFAIFISMHHNNNLDRDPAGYITPPYSQLGKVRAPSMADFSSRGPNSITPDILKVLIDKYIK